MPFEYRLWKYIEKMVEGPSRKEGLSCRCIVEVCRPSFRRRSRGRSEAYDQANVGQVRSQLVVVFALCYCIEYRTSPVVVYCW